MSQARAAMRITIIPQRLESVSGTPVYATRKRRVAAYARVSTDSEEQLNSYKAQNEYYDEYIQRNPDWEYVGIYADEGITGTSTLKRKDFNRMVEDAMNGMIDLIVTKTIARFARNTVDTLTTIRNLKAHGVEVFFESENIEHSRNSMNSRFLPCFHVFLSLICRLTYTILYVVIMLQAREQCKYCQ